MAAHVQHASEERVLPRDWKTTPASSGGIKVADCDRHLRPENMRLRTTQPRVPPHWYFDRKIFSDPRDHTMGDGSRKWGCHLARLYLYLVYLDE